MRALLATMSILLVIATLSSAGADGTNATGPGYCIVVDPGSPDPVGMDPDNCHIPPTTTVNETAP